MSRRATCDDPSPDPRGQPDNDEHDDLIVSTRHVSEKNELLAAKRTIEEHLEGGRSASKKRRDSWACLRKSRYTTDDKT